MNGTPSDARFSGCSLFGFVGCCRHLLMCGIGEQRRNAPVLDSGAALARFDETNQKRYLIITERQFSDEALKLTGGRVILRDENYIPPRPSKEGESFILINVGSQR